jgi:hypothetical protein
MTTNTFFSKAAWIGAIAVALFAVLGGTGLARPSVHGSATAVGIVKKADQHARAARRATPARAAWPALPGRGQGRRLGGEVLHRRP